MQGASCAGASLAPTGVVTTELSMVTTPVVGEIENDFLAGIAGNVQPAEMATEVATVPIATEVANEVANENAAVFEDITALPGVEGATAGASQPNATTGATTVAKKPAKKASKPKQL